MTYRVSRGVVAERLACDAEVCLRDGGFTREAAGSAALGSRCGGTG